eukprot:scaffold15327_cov58-Attheya_sp.AAC.10
MSSRTGVDPSGVSAMEFAAQKASHGRDDPVGQKHRNFLSPSNAVIAPEAKKDERDDVIANVAQPPTPNPNAKPRHFSFAEQDVEKAKRKEKSSNAYKKNKVLSAKNASSRKISEVLSSPENEGRKFATVTPEVRRVAPVDQDPGGMKPVNSFSPKMTQLIRLKSPASIDTTKAGESNVASTIIDSGVRHFSLGDYNKSLKEFQTALKIQQEVRGKESIWVAQTLGNIGAAYLQVERIDEAVVVLEQSLDIKMRLRKRRERDLQYPPSLIVLGDTLNNLGSAAYLQGDYDLSISYFLRSLEESKVTGLDDMADTLHNLGKIHLRRKEFESAKIALTASLRSTRSALGNFHMNTAETLELLGLAHLPGKSYNEAQKAFEEVLTITQKLLPECHPDIAASFYSIGLVHEIQRELPQAWQAYSSAADIYKRSQEIGGVTPPEVGVATLNRKLKILEKLLAKKPKKRAKEEQPFEAPPLTPPLTPTHKHPIRMEC